MNKNTPGGKGFRTAFQTIAGTVAAYVVGLSRIPEVREYTNSFVNTYGVDAIVVVLASFGISAGVIAYIQNYLGRKK